MSLQICDRMFWPHGLTKSFTMSYDDGITQDRQLIEIMKRTGVKAAFNINSGLMGRENTITDFSGSGKTVKHIKLCSDEISDVYRGQEIASHGEFHSCMYGMDSLRMTAEVLTCRKELEHILNHPVTGYAYAFGACNDAIISVMKNCNIMYARTISSTHTFEIPGNLLAWNPTCHHDDEKLMDLTEKFLSDEPYFSFYSPAKLFYVWGHSYEFDLKNNWGQMEYFLKKIGKHDDVWYATNFEIASYIQAYRSLIFSADSTTVYNPSCTSVWIGSMFRPVSIEVPAGKTVPLLPPLDM